MHTIMRDAEISFPFLGDLHLNPPASFELFGRSFYLYGAIVALGFLLGILYCSQRSEKFVGIPSDDLFDFILWLLPTAIIGARIYYVIFQWEQYKAHPLSVFAVWEGGLAIYGGIIAGLILVILWCRRRHIPFGALGDLSVFGLLIGQSIGRWGNFFNREAFGAETDVFCRMGLTNPGQETIYVHPTFLYESLWNLGVFLFLLWFEKAGKRRFDGHCITLYFLLYGLGRFWIEGLRTDSLYIGNTGIRVSQALSLVLVLSAAALLLYMRGQPFSPDHLYVNRVAAKEAGMIIEKREES